MARLETGRKIRALQLPPVVPHKAVGNFSKALYGKTGGTCSAQCFRSENISDCNLASDISDSYQAIYLIVEKYQWFGMPYLTYASSLFVSLRSVLKVTSFFNVAEPA